MQYRIRKQSELKPSGVEWLGDIPTEWEETYLKYIAIVNMGQSPSSSTYNNENNGVKFLQGNADFKELYPIARTSTTEPKKTSKIKDILFTVRAPVGAMNISDKEYAIGRGLCAISSTKYSSNSFLWYLMSVVKIELDSISTGSTYEAVSVKQVNNSIVIIPPLQEQRKIANFLDEKSKIFDDALSKKETLIKKLEDAKKSLISEVVSGKLKVIEKDKKLLTIKREEKELKSSGVEWLGSVPKEWEVKKSKYLFKIQKRIAGKLGYDIFSITQTGIKVKDITTGGGQLSMDYSKYQIVNIGDFAMNHMDLLTGFVDIAKIQGVTSPDYRVFSLFDKNSVSAYYLYIFQMGYKNKIFYAFGQGSSQLGRWRLPAEEFKKFYFPYPSKDEQKQIAKYLDVKIEVFNKTIVKTKQSILKLKQAKESLISEAVTGKIEIIEEKAKASSYFQRRVLAAYFIDNSLDDEYFGRVKLQKMLYMAEAVNDLDFNSDYKRHAMGPYDPKLMKSIESQLKKAKWFGNKKINDFGKIEYFALEKQDEYKKYLDGRYFKQENIEYIYNLLKGMKTLQTEIVATVYSAYKDLKEENKVSKKNLLDEILNNWHDNKKKVSQEKWEKAINWLNEKRLINI